MFELIGTCMVIVTLLLAGEFMGAFILQLASSMCSSVWGGFWQCLHWFNDLYSQSQVGCHQ